MLELHEELERWPKQAEVCERAGYSRANLNHAMKVLEKRGIITPTELVPNTVTPLGKKLLAAAKRKAGRR